jgi:acyl-CoA thioester hydrolase
MTKTINQEETPFAVLPIHTRLGDTDMFRHINNVSYLSYIESLRIEFFVQLGCNPREELAITRRIDVNYLRPASYYDPLAGLIRTTRVGESSVELEIRIVNASDHSVVYAESRVIQVHCCAKTGEKCRVSAAGRQALKDLGQIH